MADELTQEDVFSNDKDPIEAIRELRKEEGSEVDDDLQSSVEQNTSGSASDASDDDKPGDDDLDAFNKDDDKGDADAGDDKGGDDDSGKDDAGADDGDKSGVDDQGADDDPNKDAGKDAGDDDAGDGDKGKKDDDKGDVEPAARTFKANGQEFSFTEKEIMEQFETVFGQAMNYTQKMQKIAPYRKMISDFEEKGLSQDQLNISIDALKVDKGALAQIVKAHNIEAFDLTDDDAGKDYQPTQHGKDEAALDIKEVSDTIKGDKEYPITVDVIGNQWDNTSRDAFASNPQLILGLHNDVKSGKYDQVAPVAMKMKVLDGNTKSDIEYYMLAGEQIRTQEEADAEANANQQKVDKANKRTQDAVDKSEAASSEASRKRSASSTRTRADRKGVIDYLDDDDEQFDDWYKNLMSKN